MKGNISTVRELLHTSPIVIMLLADIGMKEVNELIAMVSEKTCPNPQNALITMHARLQKKRHLSCGVEKFDTALKGGLLVGSISEICGAPGAGKTQFCLSCTLQGVVAAQQCATSSGAATGAQQGGVIYIDTELKFDPNRLIQMAMERYPEMYSSEFRTDAPHQIDRLLDQVKVGFSADFYITTDFVVVGTYFAVLTTVTRMGTFVQVKRPTTMKELQEELGLLQTSVISQNISLVRLCRGVCVIFLPGIMASQVMLDEQRCARLTAQVFYCALF
jgi:RecA/RadA recombinase